MISGVTRVTITIPGPPASSFSFDAVAENSHFKKEPICEIEADGQLNYMEDDCVLDVTFYDKPNLFSRLEELMINKTMVNITAYGFEESVVWSEDTCLIVWKNYNIKSGNRNGIRLRSTARGKNQNISILPNGV